jgi:hypothetical protein
VGGRHPGGTIEGEGENRFGAAGVKFGFVDTFALTASG